MKAHFYFSEAEDREDVLITGSHDYNRDEFYLKVEGHNLVALPHGEYDDTIDKDEIKKDILEHPENWSLDGKPITGVSFHSYICDEEEDGTPIHQIEVVLFN